ncbi:conserved hypothetical protein [Culex quinquefasciatus]|uniref:Uncharacterized protein n=1 Tax=Culex quinquefasciatus TaxID=7176 RepID=B0W0J4_CULQU|nr:conserved hypothetical protein [Culex quinquefasciatus]|eukprot:XP_001842228.1 conserved hypothetical protein [Culex quinquefasciatus]
MLKEHGERFGIVVKVFLEPEQKAASPVLSGGILFWFRATRLSYTHTSARHRYHRHHHYKKAYPLLVSPGN